ncbi:hypothetical protein [Flavobacterium sp. ASW18X]|uniref:hypothetical protein n=1 Tax=Flavobacterium sp. ASW18X TaxID=2572595 RepID=UPI0010AE682E|nr:hypothetical protein [Flavobacterium sp. ASW18X]TKD65019.1 hypothetical protein FBT53_05670 [Flavobacterium sp. ASW18X]
MKTCIAILTLLMLQQNCNQNPTWNLNYRAESRGFYKELVCDGTTLKHRSTRQGTFKTLNLKAEEQESLVMALKAIDLKNISEPDQSKSMVDAAALASFELLIEGVVYSYEFDHGHPPKELEELMTRLLTLSEKVE